MSSASEHSSDSSDSSEEIVKSKRKNGAKESKKRAPTPSEEPQEQPQQLARRLSIEITPNAVPAGRVEVSTRQPQRRSSMKRAPPPSGPPIDYKTPLEGHETLKSWMMEQGMAIDWRFGAHPQKDHELFQLALVHGPVEIIEEVLAVTGIGQNEKARRFEYSVKLDFYKKIDEMKAPNIAALHGRIEVLNYLATHDFDLSQRYDGMGLFHCAALGGHVAVLDWAKAQGHDPKYYRIGMTSAPQFAAMAGHIDCLRWFKENDVPFDRKDDGRMPAAVWAARNGHSEVLKWLRNECGVKLSSLKPQAFRYKNVVHYLAKNGDLETFKWVKALPWLERPKIDGAKDLESRSVMMYACKSGNLELVQWLQKECGLKVSRTKRDQYGTTLGHFAAMSGNVELLEWLLSIGALEVNALASFTNPLYLKPFEGRLAYTLPHFAAKHGHLEALKWLQQKGAPMSTCGQAHSREPPITILGFATQSGNVDTYRWIVANYVCDSPLNNGSASSSAAPSDPQHAAAAGAKPTASGTEATTDANDITNPVAKRPDVQPTVNSDGRFSYYSTYLELGSDAVHYAARYGNEAIMEYLKYEGLDFTHQNSFGTTLAHEAAFGGNVPVLQWLLDNNLIDFYEQDHAGRTAYRLVFFSHKSAAVSWFRRHMPPELDE